MRQYTSRTGAGVAALAAAAVLLTSAAAAPGGAAARAAPRPRAGLAAAGGPARSVLMINGDKLVAAATGGARILGILPPAGGGYLDRAMLALELGGKAFEIPQAALPYLGHGLDPSLFEVASLLREATGDRLPVTVSYAGRLPSLPGVTITRAGGGTAQGYLTPAGAAEFGRALARQFAADHARGSLGRGGGAGASGARGGGAGARGARGGGAGASGARGGGAGAGGARGGMFAGGVSVGLAGEHPQAPRRSSRFPMRTLTVTATNLAGKPDTGDQVMVYNTDDAARFDDLIETMNTFDKGVTKFSVPAGHYWVLGLFPTSLKNGEIEYHLPILPQVTVSAATTVHIAERAADSEIGVTTPKPAVPVNQPFELRHTSAAGPASTVWFVGGYSPVFVSPTTRRATVGTMQAYLSEQLLSPARAAGTPYEYDLAYEDTHGLITPLHYVVQQAGLATVRARFYSSAKTTGGEALFGAFPAQWKTIPAVLFIPRRVPRQQTEYLTGNPAVRWSDAFPLAVGGVAEGQADDLRIFHAGENATENWNAYPLHEGYNTDLIGAANLAPAIPSASRKGDALTLDVTPFSDSAPGHKSFDGFAGPAGKIAGHYQVEENGKTIAAGNPLKGFKEVGPFGEFHDTVTLSPHAAAIRFVLGASQQAKVPTISAASRTVWTWRSRRADGARLLAGWTCGLTRRGAPAGGRSCAVEPMMTLEYAVRGESLPGSTPAGPQVVHLSVGHLQLVRAIGVTAASMSVSFDGGKTWHPATVTGHGGSYTATFTAPAGAKVSLRTSAADAAGGSVTETLIDGYQIAP